MPSLRHEGLLSVLRLQPELSAALRERLGGPPLSAYDDIRIESAELSDPVPSEHRADLVLSFRRQGDPTPVATLVVEVQLSCDPAKRLAWPAYLVQVYRRFGCPVYLMIVAPDRSVARWCAQPIVVSPSDMVLRPEVVGPDQIPVITDVSEASRDPELATLSAVAHKRVEVALAAALAAHPLDEERGRLYYDLIVCSLSKADRHTFEDQMAQHYEYQSEFARKYYHQGITEGEARGEAKAILTVLQERGIAVGDDVRRRILQCTDLEQLDRWLAQAVHIATDIELLDG